MGVARRKHTTGDCRRDVTVKVEIKLLVPIRRDPAMVTAFRLSVCQIVLVSGLEYPRCDGCCYIGVERKVELLVPISRSLVNVPALCLPCRELPVRNDGGSLGM